jgi:imidazolonepropionase-like amidohydrolase
MNLRRLAPVLAVLALSSLSAHAQDTTVALRAGRIITVSGGNIEDGVILIRAGRIVAVGTDIEIPWDAEIIDASDKVVLPGWVEADTTRGLDRPNERTPVVPFVTVLDSINPLSNEIEDALRQGITTLHVLPGPDTQIGGRGAIVKPVGLTVEAITMTPDASLRISLRPPRGTSRMAHYAALRRELDEIRRWIRERNQPQSGASGQGQGGESDGRQNSSSRSAELELKRAPMEQLFARRCPAYIYCDTASDVPRAKELAEEYGFEPRIVLNRDGWRAADFLAEWGVPVILSPDLVYWEADERTGREVRRVVPRALHERGVRFALTTGRGDAGQTMMWYQAATCVRHGVPRDTALRAATLTPAEILGIADQVGSIEPGKLANLQILSGDPLDPTTWVERVLVEGRVVYRIEEDRKLRRLRGEEER